MKIFYPVLLLLLALLLSGCDLSSAWSFSAAATATPAQPESPPLAQPPEAEPQANESPVIDAPLIAYNEVKEGQLDAPGAVDEWIFEAQAGERVNVVLNSQFDSYLELYGPEGEFITASDDNSGSLNAALFEVQIRKTGRHILAVRGYGGAMGSYTLTLSGGHPTVGGGLLASGESRTVILSPEGIKWHYQGKKASYLTVTATPADGLAARLALYGPDGAWLAGDDGAGEVNAEIVEFQLPAAGVYTIQAQSAAKSGPVTITLSDSPQPSGGGSLALGQSRTGSLKPGDSHQWHFTGEAGQLINLSLTSEFEALLELRDSQDMTLAENDPTTNSNPVINLFTLPANDTYTVMVQSLSADEGGKYELSLKPIKIGPGGGMLVADKLTQALLLPGQSDTWLFEAEADSFITIRVQSSEIDTYLELYGPDGALLSEDDDSGGGLNAALLDFPTAEAGEYRLVVRPAQAGRLTVSGVYDIFLTVSEDLAPTGILASGDTKTSSLSAAEQQTWIFEAERGSFVTVKMESATLDTYLSLYNNSGTLLAVNDDFLDKQAVIANFITPEDGVYRVVARAYSTEEVGDYTISLEIGDKALTVNQPAAPPGEGDSDDE
jgi:hypothetical protein